LKQLALLIVVLLSVFAPSQLSAETRYVSDSLTIFIRTGPTHEFRIVGTITAGDAVQIIADDAANKATHVRLSTGREVWVDTEQLMNGKPSSLLYSEVSSQLQQSSSSSNQQISDLQQQLQQAEELASVSRTLQAQVTQLEYDKELLDQKNQTLSDRSRYDLMTTGGVVALVGVLLGLILPSLFRRKKNDVWR
jgi:SH3 domain protein